MTKYSIKICLLIICFSSSYFTSKGNDTLLTAQLLNRIKLLQSSSTGVFPKGVFPTYRTYALNKDRQKADINIFFTGLISFTLQNLQKNFTPYQQKIANDIIILANTSAIKFKNRKGRDTYNFWPTDTPQIFPNSGWMNLFDKQQSLPDDLDDTVILLMALNANDSTAKTVHNIMQKFTNSGDKKVNNTFKSYRKIAAYSTWFGNKMPVDFDVSVLSNVLYFVQRYNLEWTKADSSSLTLICKTIEEKKHLTDAAYISPHYHSSSIIMYHLSRLMQIKPIPSLEKYRYSLINDTQQLLATADNFMDQILLQTSLMRWGILPANITINSNQQLQTIIEDESFSFFIANMASMLPDQLKKAAGSMGVGKFYYYCPAYNNLLLLENIVLQQQAIPLHE